VVERGFGVGQWPLRPRTRVVGRGARGAVKGVAHGRAEAAHVRHEVAREGAFAFVRARDRFLVRWASGRFVGAVAGAWRGGVGARELAWARWRQCVEASGARKKN